MIDYRARLRALDRLAIALGWKHELDRLQLYLNHAAQSGGRITPAWCAGANAALADLRTESARVSHMLLALFREVESR